MDQIQLLRRMSGKARLEQALMLSDFVRELVLKNIRVEKKCSRKEAVREFLKRMHGVEFIKGKAVQVATDYFHQT